MLNTAAFDSDEARLGATDAVEQHQRRHGANRGNLLDDSSGFVGLGDLHGAFGQPVPDADGVDAALRDIRQVLADQTPSNFDRIGYGRRLPPSSMPRWHGAHVSALLARFGYAG